MPTIEIPIKVKLNVSESTQQFDLTVAESTEQFELGVGTAIVTSVVEDYDGETEATPTNDEQVFSTGNKRVLNDFVVHAIPHNYGLITYNGQYITVS